MEFTLLFHIPPGLPETRGGSVYVYWVRFFICWPGNGGALLFLYREVLAV